MMTQEDAILYFVDFSFALNSSMAKNEMSALELFIKQMSGFEVYESKM